MRSTVRAVVRLVPMVGVLVLLGAAACTWRPPPVKGPPPDQVLAEYHGEGCRPGGPCGRTVILRRDGTFTTTVGTRSWTGTISAADRDELVRLMADAATAVAQLPDHPCADFEESFAYTYVFHAVGGLVSVSSCQKDLAGGNALTQHFGKLVYQFFDERPPGPGTDPVMQVKDFTARQERPGDGPARVVVEGTVVLPSPGYAVSLSPTPSPGSDPTVLQLAVTVTAMSVDGGGGVPAVVTDVPVRVAVNGEFARVSIPQFGRELVVADGP
jgi:hypothetical protein